MSETTKSMLLGRIQANQWAIMPEWLGMLGESVITGTPLSASGLGGGKSQDVSVSQRIAVFPIAGILMKNPDEIDEYYFGAVSTDKIKQAFREVHSDPSIDATVLSWNSPGGIIIGPPDLAQAIYDMRGDKPILSHTSALLCSGAYWAGSAADVITAFGMSYTGSIGVYTEHTDFSKYLDDLGIKRELISSGKNKTTGANGYPLSKGDREFIQQKVRESHVMFMNAVSKHTGLSVDKIDNVIGADAYHGEKALQLGLVHHVMTLEETILLAADMANSKGGWKASAGSRSQKTNHTEAIPMTKDELKAGNPELYQAVFAEGQASRDEEVNGLKKNVDALYQGYMRYKKESEKKETPMPPRSEEQMVEMGRAAVRRMFGNSRSDENGKVEDLKADYDELTDLQKQTAGVVSFEDYKNKVELGRDIARRYVGTAQSVE